MDGLRRWAIAVCAAAVLCTLLQRLFPDTGIGRQGRLLLPCVFLCAFLSPLAGWAGGSLLPDVAQTASPDTQALTARMRQQLTAQVNSTLLQMINQALANHGFEAKKVVTDMDIDEDGRINMGQITVYVDEDTAQWATAIRQIARQRLGTDVVVARWEDTG